jgi:hypothetical protein
MTFDVEVVLKGRDFAVTEAVSVAHGDPKSWDEAAVRDVLVQILRAIDRVEHPSAPPDLPVSLRGFSWIVEPNGDDVVIAIEIPMGAAVAGPFAIAQAQLDGLISRVLLAERQDVQRHGPTRDMTIH